MIPPSRAVDVVGAKNLEPCTVRVLATGLTEDRAEKVVKENVVRHGTKEEFFCSVPSGTFKDGDPWSRYSESNR